MMFESIPGHNFPSKLIECSWQLEHMIHCYLLSIEAVMYFFAFCEFDLVSILLSQCKPHGM